MPGLLPIILAGSHIVLAAERLPELNIDKNCQAATAAGVVKGRDEGACKRDELAARGKIEQKWDQFTPPQRTQCLRLASLGGTPSYVEVLTCLELAKAAAELPSESRMKGSAGR